MPRPAPPTGYKCRAANGYVIVRMPDHPRASPSGYVYEHLLVAERALGRPIPEETPVHHVNGDKTDNRNQNLVICDSKAYHLLLHVRSRIIALGGNPDTDKFCDTCRAIHPKSDFGVGRRYADGLDRVCREAKARTDRDYYLRTRSAKNGNN